VTGFVLNKAIQVLILDAKRDISLQADPNVELMMLFSCLNLLLDFLNVFCFAKAKHALGFETNPDEDQDDDRRKVTTMRSLLDDDDLGSRNSGDLSIVSQDDDEDDDEVASGRAKLEPLEIEDSNCVTSDRHDDEEANLNMCSAYTVRTGWSILKFPSQHRDVVLTRGWFVAACLCRYFAKYCRHYSFPPCRIYTCNHLGRSGCHSCSRRFSLDYLESTSTFFWDDTYVSSVEASRGPAE
jgi:hypothetical protein